YVVANAGKILHTAAADEHDAVLLEVVTLTGDVADDFHAVGETNTADLAKRRVRLLRSRRVDAHAHAALLRARFERGAVGASFLELATVTDELLNCRHVDSCCGWAASLLGRSPTRRSASVVDVPRGVRKNRAETLRIPELG